MDHSEIPLSVSRLIAMKILDQLTESENNELESWLKDEENKEIYNKIIRNNNLLSNLEKMDRIDEGNARLKIENKLNTEVNRKSIYRRVLKYAAAILLPLIIGVIVFQLIRTDSLFFRNEISIVPGKPKAVLELSDGRQLDLEKELNQIEENNGTVIQKKDNSIVYSSQNSEVSDSIEEFNTLKIPMGGEYQLVLSDGTKVWLNAGSQLSYPVRFNKQQRKVQLEGEAYFEVAHNINQPFIVVSKNIETRVLGTSFNVMAYGDDKEIETTLVEGSVAVYNSENNNSAVIEPGYQAVYTKDKPEFDVLKVNTTVYTAWKEGRFEFDNEPLGSIMKKVGRWYNTGIYFQDEEIQSYKFSARLKRYENIETLLGNIEMTKKVKFTIEGNQITISRNN